MHLLDTDTLTHLHAGHPRVIERLRRLDDPDVAITIITKIELLRGRFDFLLKAATGLELLRAQQLLARTEDRLAQIPVVTINQAAANQFDRWQASRSFGKLGRADLLIASIAITRGATVVTRNVRHFQKVTGLSVVNWVD